MTNESSEFKKVVTKPDEACFRCGGRGWYFVDEWFGELQGRRDCNCKRYVKTTIPTTKTMDKHPNEYEYNCIQCGKKCKIIHFGVIPDKCIDCKPPFFSISEREMLQRFVDDINAKNEE